jgi:membrane fusion protein, copper/silver efflux system
MQKNISIIRLVFFSALVALCGGTGIISCGHKAHEKPAIASRKIVYHCPMHPNYLSNKPGTCPICGMDLVAINEADTLSGEMAGAGNYVKIDPTVVQNIGVRTEKAALRTLKRDIRSSASIVADERRKYTVATKVMGYVEKLYVNYTGQRVVKGQPLFDLYSPDLVSAQAEYLSAFSYAKSADADRLLESSRERLRNWDITEEQIAALEKRGKPQKNLTLVSPADGIVTEKMVVEGQSVEPGMTLYKIADYGHVWAVGAIYQQDIPLIALGQRAEVELDYFRGRVFPGTVSYVAPELDTVSRTLMVRVDLANTPDLALKPGMNATITLRSALVKNGLTVPDQAVIRSGLRTLVVVSLGNGFFEPREITVGQSAGGYAEVIAGVNDGEEIVVSSQFLIDAESNLKTAVMKMANK